MAEPRQRLVLGADAGGTKTAALVAACRGTAAQAKLEVLGRGEGGPANPLRHGTDTAFSNVVSAIQRAATDARVPLVDLVSAVIGMAGAGTESMQREAVRFIQQRAPLSDVRVLPDFQLILPAAFPAGGIAVIAGTGSIVHGIRGERETRVGGHGYLVDDGGSGFWIGRQALRAIVRSMDGRGPRTALTEIVGPFIQQDDPRSFVAAIHASPKRLETIAAIAPQVVVAAVGGDAVARDILDRAASELGLMVAAACRTLGYAQRDYSLALAGSVLTKTEEVRVRLLAALRRDGIEPQSCEAVNEPVWGALQLAAQG